MVLPQLYHMVSLVLYELKNVWKSDEYCPFGFVDWEHER